MHIAHANDIPSTENPCKTSIEELIKNPSHYHKRRVLITGFISFQFEGHEIYINQNRLWLHLFTGPPYTEEEIIKDLDKINAFRKIFEGKFVSLVGTFDQNNSGHFGLWPAGLRDITGIQLEKSH